MVVVVGVVVAARGRMHVDTANVAWTLLHISGCFSKWRHILSASGDVATRVGHWTTRGHDYKSSQHLHDCTMDPGPVSHWAQSTLALTRMYACALHLHVHVHQSHVNLCTAKWHHLHLRWHTSTCPWTLCSTCITTWTSYTVYISLYGCTMYLTFCL